MAGLPVQAETFRNPLRVPLSADPYGVTAGDLNGDGLADIVWTERPAYPAPAVLHVLLAAGNGQYHSAPNLILPFSPSTIDCIIEDVTGDKRNDLVCAAADTSNNTTVFLVTYIGNGDGTFAAPVQTQVTGQPAYAPILTRAGDLNGDGISDVLLADAYYSAILPYLSDGQGGFKPAASFEGSFNYSVPTVADLNGDGKLDVLWPTGVRVNLGNGDGTFGPPVSYDPGYYSYCAFGDVDHDGHLDAVCTYFDHGNMDGFVYLTVLHGNPDGTFNKTPIFTRVFGNGEIQFDGEPTIGNPVLVTDLNGDGYADIVAGSGDGYCVLLGGPNTTWNGQPQEFVAAASPTTAGIYGIYGVSIADMNGDGLPDIVATGPNGLYITYAQPNGTLSSPPAPEVGQVSTSATLVDVNGDGNLDVVSAGDIALKLSLGHGDGTFSLPVPITRSGNFLDSNYIIPRVISGDFNGDGKPDLLATGSTGAYVSQNYIVFGHGDGTFDAPKPISISLGQIADLNNDGRSDVVSIQNNAGTTNVLVASLSHGDGTFTTVSTNLPIENIYSGFTFSSFGPALADFRHSGNLDAAVASFNNAYFLRGHGDGTFDPASSALALPNLPNLNKLGAAAVAAGDFDDDGKPDLAVLVQYGNGAYNLSTPTSAVWVFYGNGDGTFSSAVLAGTFNRDAQTLTAGDLNGDGLADLVLTSNDAYQDTGVLIVHALPNRAWGAEVDYVGGVGPSPLWITDINHDGRNDLIFSNGMGGNQIADSVSVLLNQPALSGYATTTTLTSSGNPVPATALVTFAAHVAAQNTSNGIPTGSVTFTDGNNSLGSVTLDASGNASVNEYIVNQGPHTITAVYTPSASFAASSATLTETVNRVSTNTIFSTFATPAGPVVYGTSLTFEAITYAPVAPMSPTFPTGTMSFFADGVSFGAVAVTGYARAPTVNAANGTLTTATLPVGTHTITCTYSGDSNFTSSDCATPLQLTVTPAASALALTSSANPAPALSPVALMATLTSSGQPLPNTPVVFTIDGVPTTVATAANGVATLSPALNAGSHAVSAAFAGDTNHTGSTNTLTQTAVPNPTTIALIVAPNPALQNQPVTLVATVHATTGTAQPYGSVILLDGGQPTGAMLIPPGQPAASVTFTISTFAAVSHTLTATFSPSDANFLPSTSAPVVLTITPSNAVLTANSPSLQIQTEHHASIGLTLTSLGNLTGTFTLSCGVLPMWAHCYFARNPLVLQSGGATPAVTPGSFSVGATLEIDTDAVYHFQSALAAPNLPGSFPHSGSFPPPGSFPPSGSFQSPGPPSPGSPHSRLPLLALAPFALLAFRRRRASAQEGRANLLRLGAPFVLLLGSASLSGCGNQYPDHTAPGVYTIQVTATSVPGTTPVPLASTTTFNLIVTP